LHLSPGLSAAAGSPVARWLLRFDHRPTPVIGSERNFDPADAILNSVSFISGSFAFKSFYFFAANKCAA